MKNYVLGTMFFDFWPMPDGQSERKAAQFNASSESGEPCRAADEAALAKQGRPYEVGELM